MAATTAARRRGRNPILIAFREAVARGDDYADAESWLANLADMDGSSDAWRYTPADIEHAERVLARLRADAGEAGRS